MHTYLVSQEKKKERDAGYEADNKTLPKVIERVYVYGADRVEIIWKTDDIFFSDEMPEKRKVMQ